jgi:NADPH2:quinone reductase
VKRCSLTTFPRRSSRARIRARLFDWIAEGRLKVRIDGVYPLAKAARAHADMASRATTGKLLLVP